MASTEEVIHALQESLISRSYLGPASSDRFGEWLEEKVTGAAYMRSDWAPRNDKDYLLGDERSEPALTALTEQQRRSLMVLLRPARPMSQYLDVIQSEALIAGLQGGDVDRMLNGLWTYSRLHRLNGIWGSSGADHCFLFWPYLEALGSSDEAIAGDLWPEFMPPARKGYRLYVVGTNLVRALRHGHETAAAVEDAELFVSRKSTKKFEALMVRYLTAVATNDATATEEHFSEIARTWASTPWAREWKQPLHKVASFKLLGLAQLGESRMPGISDIAEGTPAWNNDLAALFAKQRAEPVPCRSIVDYPGVLKPFGTLVTASPVLDFAERTARDTEAAV